MTTSTRKWIETFKADGWCERMNKDYVRLIGSSERRDNAEVSWFDAQASKSRSGSDKNGLLAGFRPKVPLRDCVLELGSPHLVATSGIEGSARASVLLVMFVQVSPRSPVH